VKITDAIQKFILYKQSLGLRYRNRVLKLNPCARLAGPVEIDRASPEIVREFPVTPCRCGVVEQVLSPQKCSFSSHWRAFMQHTVPLRSRSQRVRGSSAPTSRLLWLPSRSEIFTAVGRLHEVLTPIPITITM
jgi:hypothetical protein